jgi:acyl-CoA synthetase (AMP-forming)/AMP-acid ligase II
LIKKPETTKILDGTICAHQSLRRKIFVAEQSAPAIGTKRAHDRGSLRGAWAHSMWAPNMILADISRRNAKLFGDRVGLVFEGQRITHRAFAKRVYRVANALLDMGIRHQDRIAVLSKSSSQLLEICGATDAVGFISVVLNHRLVLRELADICLDAEPSVLFFTSEFAATASSLRAAIPSVRQCICIDGTADGALDYEAMLAPASDAEPAARAAEDDVAWLVYTSGTTGRPKGVMLTHGALFRAAMANALEGSSPDPTTGLIVMPLFHVGGRLLFLVYTLLGGTVILHANFDAEATLAAIAQERVTSMHVAPAMLQRILEIPDRSAFDTSSLVNVRYASAPMPVPLLRRCIEAFGPIFVQTYGMTECLAVTTLKAHEHKLAGTPEEVRRLASAGQPTLGVELRILRDDGGIAKPGEIGEVLIRSRSTMKGYWNNNTATVATLRGGFMHTGDIGQIDEDGFLYILDRKKDMIVSGGENIYSWEVEEALRHHPSVAEVAVIGVPDATWGETVKALVVLRDAAQAEEGELIAYCRTRIASYKKPSSIEFRPSLPRMFNGKLDKKTLREPYWQGHDRRVS